MASLSPKMINYIILIEILGVLRIASMTLARKGGFTWKLPPVWSTCCFQKEPLLAKGKSVSSKAEL